VDNALLAILIPYVCLLFSLCVHEAAHAAMANRCGDPSARLMGRMSLNPIVHIDPIGTVVMPLLMMLTGIPYLIGWAKPVPFNPRNLKNMRRDPVLIAMAGPASNLVLALIFVFVLRLLMMFPASQALSVAGELLVYMIMINLLLMLFNLIPVPPLDGHYVLHYFLPPAGQRVLEQIGPFGIIIAIVLARPVLRTGMPILAQAVDFLLSIGQATGTA
jgi:Zn-dependent protease